MRYNLSHTVKFYHANLFIVKKTMTIHLINQWQEKFARTFLNVKQWHNRVYYGKKSSRKLFLPLFIIT